VRPKASGLTNISTPETSLAVTGAGMVAMTLSSNFTVASVAMENLDVF